jgi:hypothetical protein
MPVDHGDLNGLQDDDHLHYHNDLRGDARYYTETEIDTTLSVKSDVEHIHDDRYYTETEMDSQMSGKSDIGHAHIESDITDLDKYTQNEVDSALVGKSNVEHNHDHGTLTGLGDNDHNQYALQTYGIGSGNFVAGDLAGDSLQTGANYNVLIGCQSGRRITTGDNNICIGHHSGLYITTGESNISIGLQAGPSSNASTSNDNISIGLSAAEKLTTGNRNISIGYGAGQYLTTDGNNVFIGYKAGGMPGVGDNNVFIGYQAGYNETGSNKLYIENSSSSSPLIYGEFDNNLVRVNGDLNITGNLTVNGNYPGITDHGNLTGLGDDDHAQYHNDVRADVRYYTKTQLDSGQLDSRYYTETEVDSALAGKSDTSHTHDHGSLTDLGADDHPQYMLVDGSRGFTSVVSGIDPIEDYHLATKAYVDTISGGSGSGGMDNVEDDTSPTLGGDLATGGYDILIPDNQASALDIKEGTTSYIKFVTTNGSEFVDIMGGMYIGPNDMQMNYDVDLHGNKLLDTTGRVTIDGSSGVGIYGPATNSASIIIGESSSLKYIVVNTNNDGGLEFNPAGDVNKGIAMWKSPQVMKFYDYDLDMNGGNITGSYKSSDGSAGVSGWFDDGSNFRVTIKNGIITAVGNSISGGYSVS